MHILTFKTIKTFTNITEDVQSMIPKNFSGIVHVFSQHTTAGIRILENETLLKADYVNFLEDVAPEDGEYQHNIIGVRNVPPDERVNGHSHIRTLFFPTSETIPVKDGIMQLGEWQTLFLVELDPTRERNIVVTLVEEKS